MARFRGTVEGGRGQASRLGHRHITTDANGWNCGVNVDGGAARDATRPEIGVDQFTVFATGGSSESSSSHQIARVKEVRKGNRQSGFVRQVTLFDAKGKVVEVYTV